MYNIWEDGNIGLSDGNSIGCEIAVGSAGAAAGKAVVSAFEMKLKTKDGK